MIVKAEFQTINNTSKDSEPSKRRNEWFINLDWRRISLSLYGCYVDVLVIDDEILFSKWFLVYYLIDLVFIFMVLISHQFIVSKQQAEQVEIESSKGYSQKK